MVSNCLNPACRVPFSHARDGRFFSVDRQLAHHQNQAPDHQPEQYWLCGPCSQLLKVVVEDGEIKTVPIDLECSTLAG